MLDLLARWPAGPGPSFASSLAAAAAVALSFLSAVILLVRALKNRRGVAEAAERGRARARADERERDLEAARRERDAALARARDLESQLFANVSHELRTPLALILGPTERLLGGADLRPDQRADLEVVARNARTLLKHVGDLLHVAQTDAGQLAASYCEVDLASVCRATGAHFDGFASDRDIAFTVEAPRPIPIEVDAGKLQRALLNLLSNAFKFTPVRGRVRLSARELPGQRVAIEVADSGPGIPLAERQEVFERFRRREGGATKRFGGTGLGLALVRDFVALMDGTVTIDDAPEGGALLRVELPAAAPPGTVVCSPEDSAVLVRAMVQEAIDRLRLSGEHEALGGPVHDGGSAGSADSAGSAPKPPAASPRSSRALLGALPEREASIDGWGSAAVLPAPPSVPVDVRASVGTSSTPSQAAGPESRSPRSFGERPLVLVVEDNPDMNRFIAATLAPELRVVTALDGLEGLEKALLLRPDLVVSDVMMPALPGDALVRELRSRPELDGTPIILLTAKSDDALRARLLHEGAQDYLTKPFFAEELRARAHNLVSMKRAREILQRDLSTRARDLEALAREVAQRRRELSTALDSARVARDHADRASAMKTSFLRMVSHELRTPLTSLKLNLERLSRSRDTCRRAPDEDGGGREDEMIRKIAAAATRLHELIESLLEYARIEGGRLRVEIAEVDAGALCADVIEELAAQADHKGIALLLGPTSAPPLRSDPRLLRLVIVNLVGNAVKFTHRGHVAIEVHHEGGAHHIHVRDSGPGIPPQDHERIFEPFEQMEPLPHKHTRGVGLGLSIVKEMVEALSGRIELSSVVGEGSTFTVVLPSLGEGDGDAPGAL
jgi:signal transduction histidine kinase